MKINTTERGVTLLITLLLMGVLLGVGASLLSITLKQYQLAGIAYSSEMAFQAASAGMECVLYHDFPKSGTGPFDVPGNGAGRNPIASLGCMNGLSSSDIVGGAGECDGCNDANDTESGEEQRFQFSWKIDTEAPEICSEVSVYKFFSNSENLDLIVEGIKVREEQCPQNSSCTVVKARGYNFPCNVVSAGTVPRVVEREYTQVY